MTDGMQPGTATGTTVTTGRRSWWRPASRTARPAATGVPRSTGIVELRDVARQGADAEARRARIASDAPERRGIGSESGAAGAAEAPGGEAPRRRLRWFGWISRRVIHDRDRP